MNFYIMSRGRAAKMTTWKNLPDEVRERTKIVTREADYLNYCRIYGNENVILAPGEHGENYSNKFQWIMHDGMRDGLSKCVILDDDLRFATRVGEKFLSVVSKDQLIQVADALLTMEEELEDVPLVSLHPRQMAHVAPKVFKSNGKVICIQGIGREWVGNLKVNQFPILADVILNMYCLGKGWGNRLLTDVVQDHGSCQAPGGCSDTRTSAMQKEAVLAIARKYPNYFKVSMKQPKTPWLTDENGTRWDFIGAWKKLYEDRPWSKEQYNDDF